MSFLPRRQVHLDFHTSEHIPDVGAKFDAAHFADTLKKAHVNSVNLCAKCHHGWSYYDTKVGARHPNLSFDLLRAQYDALKREGIAVVLYFTCGWEERSARLHPEWREIAPDGTFRCAGSGRNLDTGWKFMCFNSPYLDLMTAQIRELAETFPDADGFWLDIIHGNECCCSNCIASMEASGLDWQNAEDRKIQAYRTRDRYMAETTKAAKSVREDILVFHNSGHVPQGDRELFRHFTHIEIESLPTGGWGYDHFPLSAAYTRTLGKEYLGMTGKFHTMWGEFGGYKHPSALKYENALMSAFGAGCCIGDQLHPTGEIDAATYRMIGEVYAEAEAKEPWCLDAESVADIAVLSAASLLHPGETREDARDSLPDNGAVRLLLEGHFLFDVVDRFADFSRYKLLILPDVIRLDDELARKVEAYRREGGKLLLSGESGLRKDAPRFAIDLGADYEGPSPFAPDFVLADASLQPHFVELPVVLYGGSQRVRATTGMSLGQIFDPYFNRTPKHFSSHQHTPNRPEPSGYDCAVEKDGAIYLAHSVFSAYWDAGAVTTKQYVVKAIERLLGSERSLTVGLPSFGRATLTRQAKEERDVVHLLSASPIQRGKFWGKPIEVVEDVVSVANVPVSIRYPEKPGRVTLEPQGKEIPANYADGRLSFTVGEVAGHQMVAIARR